MRRAFWLLLAVTVSMTAAAQQTTTTNTHTHDTPTDIIDGAQTPELIPDNTAWRLWLLSITAKDPTHPEFDQRRQDAFLLSAGFKLQDLPAVRQVVRDFKTAYDALVEEHNSADAAGRSPSLATLRIRRDNLVNQTQASLLSVKLETAEKVETFITREKRRMRVSKTEVQP